MDIRAEFDNPLNAKSARLALEQLGAPSLGVSSQSRSSGTSTAVTARSTGLLDGLLGLFSGGGKAGAGMSMSGFKGKSIGWSSEKTFGAGQSQPEEVVIHEDFSGDHHETMTVSIDDAFAEQARAAITSAGGRLL